MAMLSIATAARRLIVTRISESARVTTAMAARTFSDGKGNVHSKEHKKNNNQKMEKGKGKEKESVNLDKWENRDEKPDEDKAKEPKQGGNKLN